MQEMVMGIVTHPYAGLTFISHQGKVKTVKWVSDGHVQFDGSSSCSTYWFPRFYRGCKIVSTARIAA
jgi:hypothetical protein